MKHYNKYLIGASDQFDPANYLSVEDEIRTINEKTNDVSSSFKVDIIVSYLKNHSLQNDWVDTNPQLTTLVISGTLFDVHIESLFDSSRNNVKFRADFESYLQEKLST